MTLLTSAEKVSALLQHLRVDAESDAILDGLVAGLTSGTDVLAEVAHGVDGAPGAWRAISDPGVASLAQLSHAALYTGGRMPARIVGESDADYLARARAVVVQPAGMLRGSTGAIYVAARQHLTGSQAVTITTFYQGSAWRALVVTYEAETPDPAAVAAALSAQAPAGMRLIHRVDPGWSIGQMEAAYVGRTIADLEADFPTIYDLEHHIPASSDLVVPSSGIGAPAPHDSFSSRFADRIYRRRFGA